MAGQLIPEKKTNMTTDERIELVLDLTRRLDLLNDLLKNARVRRSAKSETRVAGPNGVDFFSNGQMILSVG
jgi:hypothetical protein